MPPDLGADDLNDAYFLRELKRIVADIDDAVAHHQHHHRRHQQHSVDGGTGTGSTENRGRGRGDRVPLGPLTNNYTSGDARTVKPKTARRRGGASLQGTLEVCRRDTCVGCQWSVEL